MARSCTGETRTVRAATSAMLLPVALRTAQPADAPRIAAIYAHYVTTSVATFDESAPGAEPFAARIAAGGRPFLVAAEAGGVEAYGYLAPYRPRPAHRHTAEASIYVAPEARGRGLGRALLERLLAEARAEGLREVIAVIALGDDPASVALHRGCGFREVGVLERVGFKHGRWVDTLLMQRSL